MKDKIKNVTTVDLKNGFVYNAKTEIFTCLFCDTQYENGIIYKFENHLINAEKATKLHIVEKHGTVFENLLSTDKSQTGLTDTQKKFLINYYNGMSDKEIAENMNISAVTVRYQRCNFREKARQAKLILALFELLEEKEHEEIKKEKKL
jgi:predicted DNA binding protein